MKHWPVILVLLLVATPLASADWLQYGGDSARTGVAEGEGPRWNDVAFQIQLPQAPDSHHGYPIILRGEAYIVVNGTTAAISGSTVIPSGVSLVYAVNLSSGMVREVVRTDRPIYQLATDGSRLYASGFNLAASWPLDDGAPPWIGEVYAQRRDEVGANPTKVYGGSTCGPPVVEAGHVYVACQDESTGRPAVVVEAFLAADGSRIWQAPFIADLTPPPTPCVDDPSQDCLNVQLFNALVSRDPFRLLARSMNPSVVGTTLYVPVSSVVDSVDPTLEPSGGFTLYAVRTTDGGGAILEEESSLNKVAGSSIHRAASPTGDDTHVFTLGRNLRMYPATEPKIGAPQASRALWEPGTPAWGAGMVVTATSVYASSATTLHAFDKNLENARGWVPVKLSNDETWAPHPMALAGDLLIASSHRPEDLNSVGPVTLYGLDARTGDQIWHHGFGERTFWAAADGLVVAWGRGGLLTVLGSNEAAIQPRVITSGHYPAIGTEVRIDLGASIPGVHGPATEFMAEWGDGSVTDWQTEPVLRHRYAEARDAHARFYVRNDAEQTASVPLTFYVGQADPAVNIFNSPFSDEYQETTFFFLGLLITAIVAMIGIYRAGRKRRRFETELRRLEADQQRLRDDATACDTMLSEARPRARALFLEKRLEEAHASFLERRIDELRQGLRLTAVDEKLKFLPHGMVQQLRRLLADGRIDAWERSHFLDALDRERELNKAQRSQVRRMIDEWFDADSGGRA